MRKLTSILVLIATLVLCNRPVFAGECPVKPQPWPHEPSDIPPDANITFGRLDNGLRFLIRPNAEPPKSVSLLLHVRSGSLMEVEDQRGLAHFLEHMVFNGSKNFKPDELVPRMQRLGIGFGADINAFTSFDQTAYTLDLPNLKPEMLDLGFTVMRDFADGALLLPEEIEKERGVILAEKTSRDSVGYRMMQKQFTTLLPESKVAKRFPIGLEKVIETAPRERFVDLYSRHYIPARMTFIVIGDIDPAAMEKRIRETFSSMKNPENAGPDPDLGPISEFEGVRPSVFHDAELTSTDVSLTQVRPYAPEPDTSKTRAKDMPLSVANMMVNRRFARIAKMDGSPIVSGSASRDVMFNYAEIGSVDVTAADDDWERALPVLEHELRRAVEYGFTDDEFAEAKVNILNRLEQSVKTEPGIKSPDLLRGFAQALNSNSVLTAPKTDLEVARAILDKLDAEACHAAFRKFWKGAGMHLILTTKDAPEGTEKKLMAIYEAATKEAVEPPKAREHSEFAYQSFGKPGTVTNRTEVEGLGITQIVLSNGVKVNLKPTDFEADTIRLLARIDGCGALTRPAGMPGLGMFAGMVMNAGGLGKHSVEELKSILAGRNVGATFSVDEDCLQFSGATTPDDLALELRLMCAGITDPGMRPEAVRQFRKAVPMIFQQLRHSPAGAQAELDGWLHGDDPRFMPPKNEQDLLMLEPSDVKAWIGPALAGGAIELSIVGDFKTDTLVPLLLETFGALDRSPAVAPVADAARHVEFPARPAKRTFTYDSKVPKGMTIVAWKTMGLRGHIKEFRRMNILGDILSDRLREEIREKLGASYSPRARTDGSTALDDFGYLAAFIIAKPGQVAHLGEIATGLAEKFAETGATPDELDRSMKPLFAQLKKSLRDNGYWLNSVMSRCQAEPERLELARGRDADYASISIGEINALAKKYLGKDNAVQGMIVSKAEGE